MNENIDLTENRDFRTPAPVDETTKFLTQYIWGKFPWSKQQFQTVKSDEDLGISSELFSPIPLGDGEQRRNRKYIENAVSSEMCDRCGKPVQRFPWELRECLCVECNRDLEIEFGANRIFQRYTEVIPNADVLNWF